MATNIENAAGVGLTILVVTQIPQLYANLLPYPVDIEKFHPEKREAMSARKSEIMAGGLAVGLGFAGSLITQTPWPFFAALVLVAALSWHYERAIRYYDGELV